MSLNVRISAAALKSFLLRYRDQGRPHNTLNDLMILKYFTSADSFTKCCPCLVPLHYINSRLVLLSPFTCFFTQASSLHKHLLYTSIFFTQASSLHKHLLYTSIFFTQASSLYKHLLYTSIFFTQASSLHKHLLYTSIFLTVSVFILTCLILSSYPHRFCAFELSLFPLSVSLNLCIYLSISIYHFLSVFMKTIPR